MLRKVLAIALAIMLISAMTAFACGGDKTADNQKVSTEKYSANGKTEATVQTASETSGKMNTNCAHPENCVHPGDCPYLKEMKTASASQGEEATVKQADYTSDKASACSGSKDVSMKTASTAKSEGCSSACVKAKEAASPTTKDAKKIDPEKTAMTDQKEPAGDM